MPENNTVFTRKSKARQQDDIISTSLFIYLAISISPSNRVHASGGILFGVKCDLLEVRNVVMGDFEVKFRVRSKADGFNWALVAVYGAAQLELKPEFLADLV